MRSINYKKARNWFKGPRGQKILLVIFGVAVIMYIAPQNDTLEGEATAAGGIGLNINSEYVLLYGIETLSPLLQCERAGIQMSCMVASTEELALQIKNRNVRCEKKISMKQGLTIAHCLADGLDLSKHLVKMGWATAAISVTEEYLSDEVMARKESRGLWSTHQSASP